MTEFTLNLGKYDHKSRILRLTVLGITNSSWIYVPFHSPTSTLYPKYPRNIDFLVILVSLAVSALISLPPSLINQIINLKVLFSLVSYYNKIIWFIRG